MTRYFKYFFMFYWRHKNPQGAYIHNILHCFSSQQNCYDETTQRLCYHLNSVARQRTRLFKSKVFNQVSSVSLVVRQDCLRWGKCWLAWHVKLYAGVVKVLTILLQTHYCHILKKRTTQFFNWCWDSELWTCVSLLMENVQNSIFITVSLCQESVCSSNDYWTKISEV